VAVLPFANLSADPENVFFGDGLAEELINGLARIPQLRVASRTSAFRFRDGDHDVREIARQLNVDAVLEGSVRRIGKRVRISVQLVNAIDGYQLWSERYDREMVDIFTIEDEITTSIVSTLEPTLLGGPQVSKRHTGNPQAYELYLKGRHFWDQRTGQTLRAALECFEGAVDFDPGYALAYAGIADCYSMLAIYDFIPREEGRPRALLAAQTAMTLDEALPECHYTMALFTIFFEKDWSQGGAHFVRARELSPRAAHIVVHHAVFLAARHERDEARAVARRAIELDPLSPFVHTVAAFTMYVSRSHLEAIRCAERALDLDPGYAQGLIVLGLASCAVGDDEHAIEAFTRLVSVSKRTTLFTALLAFAHGRAGREDEARTILRELEARQQKDFVGPFSRWAVCLGLDDTDALCTWFDACIADGVTGYAFELFFGPFLDALTVDPRLAEYLRRLSIVLRSRG